MSKWLNRLVTLDYIGVLLKWTVIKSNKKWIEFLKIHQTDNIHVCDFIDLCIFLL